MDYNGSQVKLGDRKVFFSLPCESNCLSFRVRAEGLNFSTYKGALCHALCGLYA
jgi:hypothetical protein